MTKITFSLFVEYFEYSIYKLKPLSATLKMNVIPQIFKSYLENNVT